MSAAYTDAPFTLDGSVPIPDDAVPSITYQGDDADDLKQLADEFYEVSAGPLSLTVEVSGRKATAKIDGATPQTDCVIDWGDGYSDVVSNTSEDTSQSATGTHTYDAYGTYSVAGYATVEGTDYVAGQTVDVLGPAPESS